MNKKKFYDTIKLVDKRTRNGLITLSEAEKLLYETTEQARFQLDTDEWIKVKRRSWYVLLDLTNWYTRG